MGALWSPLTGVPSPAFPRLLSGVHGAWDRRHAMRTVPPVGQRKVENFTVADRSRVRAIEAGTLARRLLAIEGCHGTVEAVLTNTLYLATSRGELLWLHTDGKFPHRRYVRVSFGFREIEPGMPFTASDGVLRIGDAVQVEVRKTACWSPPCVRPGATLTVAELRAGLGRAAETVRCSLAPASDDGFLRLVLGSLPGGTGPSAWPPLLQTASAAVERVAAACRNRDLPAVFEAGFELIGLGPGFTPAGDDYLGGLLFTLHHLHRASADLPPWGEGWVAGFLAATRSLTGWASHAILSDLACGHGPGPLHDLVARVLNPAPASDLAACVDCLCRIGHSSGRDVLAGVLTARWWVAGTRDGGNWWRADNSLGTTDRRRSRPWPPGGMWGDQRWGRRCERWGDCR